MLSHEEAARPLVYGGPATSSVGVRSRRHERYNRSVSSNSQVHYVNI